MFNISYLADLHREQFCAFTFHKFSACSHRLPGAESICVCLHPCNIPIDIATFHIHTPKNPKTGLLTHLFKYTTFGARTLPALRINCTTGIVRVPLPVHTSSLQASTLILAPILGHIVFGARNSPFLVCFASEIWNFLLGVLN